MKAVSAVALLSVLGMASAFVPAVPAARSTVLYNGRGTGGMFDTRNPEPKEHEDPRKSISRAPTFEEYMKQRSGASSAPAASSSYSAPATSSYSYQPQQSNTRVSRSYSPFETDYKTKSSSTAVAYAPYSAPEPVRQAPPAYTNGGSNGYGSDSSYNPNPYAFTASGSSSTSYAPKGRSYALDAWRSGSSHSSSSYAPPASSYAAYTAPAPASSYSQPSGRSYAPDSYKPASSSYSAPSSSYSAPSSSYSAPSSSYSSYSAPSSSYSAPAAKHSGRGVGGMNDTRDPEPMQHEDPRKSISRAPTFEEYLKQRRQ